MKAVLTIGGGVSGGAATAALRRRGVETMVAANDNETLVLAPRFAATHPDAVAVASPGFAPDGPALRAVRAARLPIVSEIGLGAELFDGRVIAVTGSKGKSSIVKFIADALSASGRTAEPCGNYGVPFCEIADRDPLPQFAVLECSSFQLETPHRALQPESAVLLNLSSDHLDRHGTLEAYLAAKLSVFEDQPSDALALLPSPDDTTGGVPDPATAFAKRFPWRRFETFGVGADADWRWRPGAVLGPAALGAPEMPIAGSYFDNEVLGPAAAAAAAALMRAGLSPAEISSAARRFAPLPHRMQATARGAGGAIWIDNSKATSLAALLASVKMAPVRPVVLLAGGRLKEPLSLPGKELLDSGVRFVYTLGECGAAMASFWRGALPAEYCGTLAEAARRAAETARTLGHCTVLLAPGTASFDQFKSFEERGDAFAALSHALA